MSLKGLKISIVVGGGNILGISASSWYGQMSADYTGMMATVINYYCKIQLRKY